MAAFHFEMERSSGLPSNVSMQVMLERGMYSRKNTAERPSHEPISRILMSVFTSSARTDVHVENRLELQSDVKSFPSNQASQKLEGGEAIFATATQLTSSLLRIRSLFRRSA